MRRFNDSEIDFYEAVRYREGSIKIDLNKTIDPFPEGQGILIDPPAGLYNLKSGILPILEYNQQFFRKNNLGELVEIHDIEKVVGSGITVYDQKENIVVTAGESSFLNNLFYGRDFEILQERAKRRTIPFLFLSSYILNSLRERICGKEVFLNHLFSIKYLDKVYDRGTLLDTRDGKHYLKHHECYIKEALTSKQQEDLDIALDGVVSGIINALRIGKFKLPIISGTVANSILELHVGMDIRIISQILEDEEQKEQ